MNRNNETVMIYLTLADMKETKEHTNKALRMKNKEVAEGKGLERKQQNNVTPCVCVCVC